MLDPQAMTSFLAVVNAGSFVGAAEATGLSKAAVSRHVAELEQRLGVRLLHRTTRRLSLTDDGQRFQARAAELLAAMAELEAEMSSSTGEATGLLRINAPLSFGILHLAPLWARFAAQNPKLRLDVTLNDRVVDLVEEGYDVAVRITNLASSQLVSRRLATTRIVLCASPAYLAAHGTPTHPRELAAHQIISYAYWSGGDDWRFTGPDGEAHVRVQPRIHTNSGDTCRAAALAGQGVILQPDFIVGADLQRGDLVELMPQWRALELGIHVVYASRKHLPMKTRRLVDFLVEAFRAPAWERPPAAPSGTRGRSGRSRN
jgi:DNA-binding transcriptional LysR family regulator